MMRNLVALIFLLAICKNTIAQQKKGKWYNSYWLAVNTSILKGTEEEKSTIGVFADVGRFVKHNFMVGAGAGFVNYQKDKKVTVVYGYLEKNIGDKNRKIFFYSKPGIAFAYKPTVQLQTIDRFEYWKTKPGLHFQAGGGIRWMVGRHSFYISTGFSKVTYSIFTKEYPLPVDPYNPFIEDDIVHKYEFGFSKLIFNMGLTF
jgi:hypothetical protein